MEKYYALILELRSFLFLKYQERENIKQELNATKEERTHITRKIIDIHAKLSQLMEYQEEHEEKTIYEMITMALPILLIIIIIFCSSLKVLYIKLIVTCFLLNIAGISASLKKRNSITKKYEKIREDKEPEISKLKDEVHELIKEDMRLRSVEKEIYTKITEIEKEIAEKEELKRVLQDNVIYSLGPQLDALIEKEIIANNNEGLANTFKRIRELMNN